MIHISAMLAPYPFSGQLHNYVCHTACIYWALRVKYPSEGDEKIARRADGKAARLCPLCLKRGHDAHDTLSDVYGNCFEKVAVKYNEMTIRLGDIILFGALSGPAHSAVCSGKLNGAVMVRGYNNCTTFQNADPMPLRNVYDPYLRDMAIRVDKHLPVLQVPSQSYIEAIVKL